MRVKGTIKKFHRHASVSSVWFEDIKKYGCKMVETSRTLQIKTDETKHIIAQNHLTGTELNIINAVQRDVSKWYEAEKNKIDFYGISNKKINYKNLHLQTLKRNLDKTVHCYDLRSAYPTYMFKWQMISKETWDKICDLPKTKKLWMVGAIASTKHETTYVNGVETMHEVKVKPTKIVWHFVVYNVDRIMQKLFSEFRSFFSYNYFSLAYYVDCLFVLCDSPDLMGQFEKEFSEMVFKEGFSYGYSQLLLKDFNLDTKKLTLESLEGVTKSYSLSNNGYFNADKLIEGT